MCSDLDRDTDGDEDDEAVRLTHILCVDTLDAQTDDGTIACQSATYRRETSAEVASSGLVEQPVGGSVWWDTLSVKYTAVEIQSKMLTVPHDPDYTPLQGEAS